MGRGGRWCWVAVVGWGGGRGVDAHCVWIHWEYGFKGKEADEEGYGEGSKGQCYWVDMLDVW